MSSTSKSDLPILGIVASSGFLSGYDYTALNVVIPKLAAHFDVSFATTSWVLIAYALVFVGFALPAANLLGVFGSRIMILIGFGLFALGSLLCSLSDSIYELTSFRVLQAIGGSILFVAGPVLVRLNIPAERRTRAYGIVGLAPTLGICAGPGIGAVLISTLGWPWIFVVNLPVTAIGFVLALMCLKQQKRDPHRQRADITGAFLSFCGLTLLVLAINRGPDWGWLSVHVLSLGLLGILCIWGFVWFELRGPNPGFDLRLFANKHYRRGVLAAALQMFVFGGLLYLFPIYLELGRGLSTGASGALLTIQSLALISVSLLASVIAHYLPAGRICQIGLVLTVGAAVLIALGAAGSLVIVGASLALMGLAKGIFMPAILSFTLDSLPDDAANSASGMAATMRVLGQLSGIVVFGALATERLGPDVANLQSSASDLGDFRMVFVIAATLSCFAILPLIFRWPTSDVTSSKGTQT